MRIEKATLKELESIVELFELYRQFYNQEANAEEAESFLKQRLLNNEAVIYVAYDQNIPVGFTQLYPSFSSLAMKKIWILNDLYVKEEARNKGVANQLIDQAIELTKETDAKGILLETNVENIPAQKLYDKLGFKRETNMFYFLTV